MAEAEYGRGRLGSIVWWLWELPEGESDLGSELSGATGGMRWEGPRAARGSAPHTVGRCLCVCASAGGSPSTLATGHLRVASAICSCESKTSSMGRQWRNFHKFMPGPIKHILLASFQKLQFFLNGFLQDYFKSFQVF